MNDIQKEKPPVFKTWNQVYVFVLVLHTLLISFFYLLTQAYA